MFDWLDFDNSIFVSILFAVNILLILVVIFWERKSPSATMAWVLVLAFLPVIGFIFYIVFNQNLTRTHISRLTDDEEYKIDDYLSKQIESMEKGKFRFTNDAAENWRELVKLNQIYGHSVYADSNSVEVFPDGNEFMEHFGEDIRAAEKSIECEFFIVKPDEIGMAFIDLLTEKAKEGVEVRLLMDAMGSRHMQMKNLSALKQAGGHVEFFFRPKFLIVGLKLNYRNHRKIAVIDDKIAYTGGYNIAREYVGLKDKFGYWRDTHIRFTGNAVTEIKDRFILDWRFTAKNERYLGLRMDLDDGPVVYGTDRFAGPGNVGMQIVSSGPDAEQQEVKRAFLRMIASAKKSVWLQTPYFVPDQPMLESLKMAALSGVDVKLMIPRMPDHMFVYWATFYYAGELIHNGVEVYVYDKGFLHAKTMVVDGEVASVGSTNFDIRSFRLNFETNAFIYDADVAKKMQNLFKEDMKSSHELTLARYEQRGLWIKFKEAISRILADIL